MNDLRELLQDLPVGTGVADPSWFVGRRRELIEIEGSVLGRQTGSLWVQGPRRIGKTSVANRAAEIEGADVVCVSAGARIASADQLLAEVAAKCRDEGSFNCKPSARGFTELVARLERPLVAVVDEFDRLVISLSRDELAQLRCLAHDHDRFGWLFLTRYEAASICAHHDEQSWLLGICQSILLGFLHEDDVFELAERFSERASLDDPERLAAGLYERVGGFPSALVNLLRKLATELIAADGVTAGPIEALLDRHRQAVTPDLGSLWRDLPYEVRRAFLETGEAEGDAELSRVGLCDGDGRPHRPAWLGAIAQERGPVATGTADEGLVDLASSVLDRIKRCNDLARALTGTRIFEPGDRVYEVFKLARPATDESSLAEACRRLHQLVVEATPRDAAKKAQRRLRDAHGTFQQSPGRKAIDVLRNFGAHDPGLRRDPDETREVYDLICEVNERYLGKKWPSAPHDFRRIHETVLQELALGLDAMTEVLETSA